MSNQTGNLVSKLLPGFAKKSTTTTTTTNDDEYNNKSSIDITGKEEEMVVTRDLERDSSEECIPNCDRLDLYPVEGMRSVDDFHKTDTLGEYGDKDNKNDDEKDARSIPSSSDLMNTFLEDDIHYPEGGFKAYLVVFGAFLGLVPVFGTKNTFSVFETYIEKHQLSTTSTSTIAWIFSIFSFFMFSTSVLSGFYFDYKGCRTLMLVGTSLHFTSLMLVSICTKVWHFILCFSLLGGLASGILFSPLISCTSHYFKRKRGSTLAICTVGGSIGGIVYPLMLNAFFKKNDYKWGCRTMAFLDLFLLLISTSLIKERFHSTNTNIVTELKKAVDFKSFLNKNYLFCVIGVVLAEMSITSGLTFYGSYCQHMGLSSSDANHMITIVNTLGIAGRCVTGYLSDKVGRYNMTLIMLTLLTFVTFVGWLPFGDGGISAMYAISALYGFSSAGVFSLLPASCGQISDTKDFGKKISTMYSMVAFGILVAIPISGAIITPEKTYHGYQHFIIFCSVLSILSGFAFYISRYFSIQTFRLNVIF